MTSKLRTILARCATLALLVAGLTLPAWAQLTAHDVARLRLVTQVAMSPDGTRVAYVLSVPREPWKEEEDGEAWAELHVVGLDRVSRPFVSGKVNVRDVAWTPDGKSIAFLAKRDGDKTRSLYLIAADGGEARRVVAHDTDISAYSFSSDGKRVAFLAEEAESKESKELEEKGFKQKVFEEELKFVRVWIADLGDEKAKPRKLELEGSASELHWAPVGNLLVVALAPTPLVDDDLMARKVHVVDADSSKVVARIENPGKLGAVAWSPDAKNLAIISAVDLNDPDAGRLLIAPAGGGPLRDMLPDIEYDVAEIAWQDERAIMFIADEGVWTTFNQLNADISNYRTPIVQTGGPVLTGLSLARDIQAAAFLAQRPSHPPEVYVMKHGDPGPRRLTDSNPWLAERKLAPQEVIEYKARDGLRIQGLLIRPLNEEKGKKYPLIVVVHGGPEAHYRNGWLTNYGAPGQVAAAQGYAVFYPNYRASTGRGVAFSKLDHGDPAGKEFDDVVDGVDYLVGAGLADKARVGVTGGSYGGFATAWLTSFYSERFAAGVMLFGISDLISKEGTTDIPNENYDVHYLKHVWDDWEFFRQRSPIVHTGKSKTPLLIAHGESDTRVHPVQSLEMYRYRKLRSAAPTRLVWYPGEPHGFRRAASRLDFNLRMMQWFDLYLKGTGGPAPATAISYDEK
ncbi:MAG TPA: S9 family peptidase [Candidatus Acidoferrales bacterium]|nr:S9 family peptidase [Candidatus Acidoferrales bacterium]